MRGEPVEVWGHRGARGLFPENTIEGIEAACALGIDGVEIDVALTADGVAVLSHDPSLSPDIARADRQWIEPPGPLIHGLTAAALAGYDVGRLRPGSAMALRFPDQAPYDGARVPTLAAALALGCRLVIEIKTFADRPDETATPEAMAEAVARAITAAGALGRVMVESFDWRCQRAVRQLLPGVALAWLTRKDTEAEPRRWWGLGEAPSSVPQAAAAAGGGTWAPEWQTLSEARIAAAHALGLRVLAWTVNEPGDIARLVRWGADGIITDRPDLARPAVLAAGGQLSGTPPR